MCDIFRGPENKDVREIKRLETELKELKESMDFHEMRMAILRVQEMSTANALTNDIKGYLTKPSDYGIIEVSKMMRQMLRILEGQDEKDKN